MKRTQTISIRYSMRNHGKQPSTLTALKQAFQNARCRNRLWHYRPPYPGADNVQQPHPIRRFLEIFMEGSISRIAILRTHTLRQRYTTQLRTTFSTYPQDKPKLWHFIRDSFWHRHFWKFDIKKLCRQGWLEPQTTRKCKNVLTFSPPNLDI